MSSRLVDFQAAVPSNAQQLAALCTNLTIFKEMVAVDDSIIDSGLLQQTVCSLDLNYTALFNELMQNWDGFGELVDAVCLLKCLNFELFYFKDWNACFSSWSFYLFCGYSCFCIKFTRWSESSIP